MAAIARSRIIAMLAALLLAPTALGLAGCGGDEPGEANETDRAFAAEMIPHHEMAVQMAEAAQDNGSREAVRALADDIVTAQNAEIRQLRAAVRRMEGAGIAEGDLGISASLMGMDMDMAMLDDRAGFDRMFIDMMIPHHQGAIRMARVELEDGGDPEMRRLAKEIIAAQSREIERMNAWRSAWYGEPSPSGGVPDDDDAPSPHADDHAMGHGS